MCNQNQGKEKKKFPIPLITCQTSPKVTKKLEKVFITNQYYQHTIPNLYFVQKLSPRKSLKNCRKLRSFYIWRENSNI